MSHVITMNSGFGRHFFDGYQWEWHQLERVGLLQGFTTACFSTEDLNGLKMFTLTGRRCQELSKPKTTQT
jgi:hypothetical protein